MSKLAEAIGLPADQLRLHQAILDGLSSEVVLRLADRIGVTSADISVWLQLDAGSLKMSPSCGYVLSRLVDTYELLFEVMEGNLPVIAKWLTSPNFALSNEPPIQVLRTETGGHLVRRLVLSIDYGLPV